MALVGMTLGIVGIVLSCLVPLGTILALVALLFSIVGLGQINKQPGVYGGKGMAIAGIVLGAVGLLVSIVVVLHSWYS